MQATSRIELDVNENALHAVEGTSAMADEVQGTDNRCESELIRIPGAVQQHGFLLLTEGDFGEVLVASENAERFLESPLQLILGARLETLLGRELLATLKAVRHSPNAEHDGLVTYLGSFRLKEHFFSVTTHCVGERRVMEFELQDRLVGAEMMNSVITNFVATLGRLRTQEELCDALVKQISDLTGFDRVLLYSFDEGGHGTVLAEENNGRLPSYHGLRFPASDIPQQARDLYLLNTLRIIPDAGYTPSPLRGLPGQDASGLDLSLSQLRSVAPVHLEYMKNMGTASSMSVSLVTEGRLWGLVSGHHAEPRLVPYLVRSACDMLSKMAATQLTSFQTAARLEQMVQFHSVQRGIITELAAEQNFPGGLAKQLPQLLRVTNADGVALIVEDHIAHYGEAPPDKALWRLTEWLDGLPEMDVWSSSHLCLELPWADDIRGEACGLIAVRISAVQRRYVLWFRPEIVKTVRWAGEPDKIVDQAQTLHPRHSFAEWKETVRGTSVPWSREEIDSAREFRSALTTIGLRRAEEAIELGEARFRQLTQALPVRIFTADDAGRLTYTNERWQDMGLSGTGRWFDVALLPPEDAEMCAERWALTGRMTSVIAHEINNPLEAITNLMYLLRAEIDTNGPATAYIGMVESELERISGITKQTLRWNRENSDERERFRAGDMVDDVLRLFAGKIRNRQITIRIQGEREVILAGVIGQLRQVLANLVSNAIDASPVGGRVCVTVLSDGKRGREVGFAVSDDGRGISPDLEQRIFEPFYSTKGDLGNGLGLYISREIVERHGGEIEVDSVVGKGTTMRVWLPRDWAA